MSIQFDAESIFEIGVQIEKNGQAFYQEAAKKASDKTVSTLFAELAEWENNHIELFQRMQAELPEDLKQDTVFDPDHEMSTYLEAAADSHVFMKSENVSQRIAECTSPAKAINLALEFEKDSVVYYTTIKKVVPDYLGKDKLDLIIDEELHHIAILHKKKRELGH